MRFYDREKEKKTIISFARKTDRARIVVLTGRRRIGKTRLLLELFGEDALYLFTKKKSYIELIKEWSEILREYLGFQGWFRSVEEMMNYILDTGKNKRIVVIFDEIQNLYFSKPSAFGEIQKVFDTKKEKSKVLLIFTGSVFSLMEKIFQDKKEPLFGRASEIMELKPLPVYSLENVLQDYVMFSGENLLHLFSITGGIPYYIEELMEVKGKSFKEKLKSIIVERDLFWEEGENLLKGEMGKEYSVYFSILSAIAKGKRTRSEISQFTGIKELGGYISSLEKTFKLIEKRIPVLKKPRSKLARYYIKDNFLDFWFSLVEKYSFYREIGRKEKAFNLLWKELPSFEGKKLENLVFKKIIEESPVDFNFDKAGGYWDRKGRIEVDLLLINSLEKIAIAFEIKRNRKKISARKIKELEKLNEIIGELKHYKIIPAIGYLTTKGVSIEIVR